MDDGKRAVGAVAFVAMAAMGVAHLVARVFPGASPQQTTLSVSGGAALPPSQAGDYIRLPAVRRDANAHVWSPEELSRHSGETRARPLLLAVLGEVFDVGPGARHYGPKGSYSSLAGRDASRAFATGDFENDLFPRIDDLDPEAVLEVLHWRSFYREHEEYYFVGFLSGPYFDQQGRPTRQHTIVEETNAAQSRVKAINQELSKRFMSCNSRFDGASNHFEVWCDDSYHPPGAVPVSLQYVLPAALPGAEPERSRRCACVTAGMREVVKAETAAMAGKPQSGRAMVTIEDYSDCPKGAQRCKRLKGSLA